MDVSVYKSRLDRMGELIAGVKPSQFGGTTPCKSFTTKQLLNHIVGGNYFMADIFAGKKVDPTAEPGDLIGDDPATAYEASKKVVLDQVSDPKFFEKTYDFGFAKMPGQQAFGLALIESTVHAWDLGKATGQDPKIDPQLAARLLEGAKQGIGPDFRNEEGNPFGQEVSVPGSATPVEKLVAFLGRKP